MNKLRIWGSLVLIILTGHVFSGLPAPRAFPWPVPLESFTVSAQEEEALLQWDISREYTLIGFHVLRAADGNPSYERLNTTLLPAVLQETGGAYAYRDETAAPGQPYMYKLDMVFADGSRQESEPIAFEGLPEDSSHVPRRSAAPVFTSSPHPPSARSLERRMTAAAESRATADRKAAQTGDRVKIRVRDTGLYHLGADAIAQKLNLTSNEVKDLVAQRLLRLSSQGNKCSWLPAAGNDGIYFHNQAIDSLYTEYNVFWLEAGSRGIVLPPATGETPASPGASNTVKTVHFEEQRSHQKTRFFNILEDYWLWASIYGGSGSTNVYFQMDPIDHSASNVSMKVFFCGGSSSGVPGEHHAFISINGTDVGDTSWENNLPHTGTFEFASSLLSNGVNVLNMRGVLDDGVPYSLFYLDSFDVTCSMKNEAISNRYAVPPSTNPLVQICNFTGAEPRVIEVIEPLYIREVANTHIVQNPDTSCTITFPATPGNLGYVVGTPEGWPAPDEVTSVAETSLLAETNAVDYLLITHPNLLESTRQLERFRAERHPGLRARTILTDDIYDAFSYGLETPLALTRMLKYASEHWQAVPDYVLLAGEASFDYKNYLKSYENLVPCLLVPTPYNLNSSDNTLADIAGNDGVPDFSIGRLPAATASEMSNLVQKIIAYENYTNPAPTALFVADNPDTGGDFAASCDTIASLLTNNYGITKAYLGPQTITQVKSTWSQALYSGLSFWIYFGHGAWNRLAGEGIIRITDMSALTNAPRLPIALLMTCVPNWYEYPQYDYVGEMFMLTPQHGAIASWGPSGESLNSQAQEYCRHFISAHLEQPSLLLGDLAREATRRSAENHMPRSETDIMTLLGEPMLTVRKTITRNNGN